MKTYIVLGPPGTGKTTRLIQVLEKALASGIPPSRIAYVSFTNAAADEAVERVRKNYSWDREDFRYFRTIHSLANREFAKIAPSGAVMKPSNYRDLGRAMGMNFSFTPGEEMGGGSAFEGDRILRHYDLARQMMIPWQDYFRRLSGDTLSLDRISYRLFSQFVLSLEAYKKSQGLIDFADMLINAHSECRPIDIDLAIIDEAQDLTKLQWKLCERLFAGAKERWIAGDDDQAIYTWAGADVDYFQSIDGEIVQLEKSWRLPRPVWDFAERISSRIKKRYTKTWQPADHWGKMKFVERAWDSPVLDPKMGEWLVLARNRVHAEGFSRELVRLGESHFVGKKSPVQITAVKAVQTWLKLQRGEYLTKTEADTLYMHLLGGRQIKRGFKESIDLAPDELDFDYALLVSKFGLKTELETPWWKVFEKITDADFMKRVWLKDPTFNSLVTPRIRVDTIHSVKGAESQNVLVLPHMSKRTWQGYQSDPDSEHRVYYVAATRAKERLYVSTHSVNPGYIFPNVA